MTTELEQAIAAQPDELERLAAVELPARVDALAERERVWLIGTGSSWHAAELGADMLALAGLDARSLSSARFASSPLRLTARDAVMVLTHTAGTAYARRLRDQARDAGAALLSLTGEGSGWPDALELTARERGETYTVSYTATLLTLARLASRWGATELSAQAIAAVAPAVRAALAAPPPEPSTPPARLLTFCGAGPAAVTAREGALKVREAARLPGEAFDAETLLHGAAVPLGSGDALVLVDPAADPDGLVAAVGDAAAAAGVAVSRVADPSGLPPLLAQIPLTVPLQRLALRLALHGGHDPDVVIVGPWQADRLWALGGPGA